MKKAMSGDIPPDPTLLSMASNAITNKIENVLSSLNFNVGPSNDKNNTDTKTNDKNNSSSNNSPQISEEQQKEKQKVLDDMKNDIKKFTDIFIEKNSSEKVDKTIKTEVFTIDIKSNNPNYTKANRKKDIKERISVANLTECENILRKEYNISESTVLLLKKVEFTAKMDIKRANNPDASQGLTFEFIDPNTMKKLDTKFCNNTKSIINIPFKGSDRLRMDMYDKSNAINKGLDIYNNDSPAYYSRCVKTNQIDTGADVSINYKRNTMFQNTTINCSPGCEYEGLDENKYVKCNCDTNGNQESSNTGNQFIFDPLPSMNYAIVKCYRETYNDVI